MSKAKNGDELPEVPIAPIYHHLTVTFEPEGAHLDVNATVVEMYGAAKLIERAAGQMLDQADMAQVQAMMRAQSEQAEIARVAAGIAREKMS
jgi:hypothetical protein